MPCTSPYFDGALFNFMDIAQVEAPIAQLGAPELFGARGKLPPPSRRPCLLPTLFNVVNNIIQHCYT